MRARIERISKYAKLRATSIPDAHMDNHNLPFPYTPSGAQRERLKGGSVVVAVLLWRGGQEALRVEDIRIGKVVTTAVGGPLMHAYRSLERYQSYSTGRSDVAHLH